MDVTTDPALPSPHGESTARQKSSTAVPEHTEEDEQRLFRLYKGWTFSERDGQVRQWVYQLGYDIQNTQQKERR